MIKLKCIIDKETFDFEYNKIYDADRVIGWDGDIVYELVDDTGYDRQFTIEENEYGMTYEDYFALVED